MQITVLQADPLDLDPAAAPYDLADHAEAMATRFPPFQVGLTPQMFYPSIAEMVAQAEQGAFVPVMTRNIGYGLQPVVISARVAVQNSTDQDQPWILAFNRAAQYYFAVYFVADGQPLPDAPIFAFDVDFDVWDNSDVLIHTPFVMPARTSGYLYVAFQSLNGAAPMTLEVPQDYQIKRRWQDIHFFAVIGLTLGLVVITASLMLTLRRFVAVYYTLAVVSGILLVLVSEQYIGVLAPRVAEATLGNTILSYAALVGPVFALLFQWQFFADVGGTGKVFGRVLLFAGAFSIVSLIGVIEYAVLPAALPLIALLVCVLLILVNGMIAVRKGFVGRWTFLVGSAAYAVGAVVKVTSYEVSHLISAREASIVLLYAIAIEALALAVTMFMHVRALRGAKDQALEAQIAATAQATGMAKAMSDAAHDIQQPLASLRMAMAGQGASHKTENVQEAIDYLEEIVKRQLTDPHQLRASDDAPDPFEMTVLLGNIQTMFGNEARDKGLSLRIMPSRARVAADVFVVMRIVSNLVSNAIKNTPQGGILIGCRSQGPDFCIDVIDTGIGMTATQIATLSLPQEGHVGQGLGIIRELCAANGLATEVHSVQGRGTRVRLRVPRAPWGMTDFPSELRHI
jgi:signal transduction histidine kinase